MLWRTQWGAGEEHGSRVWRLTAPSPHRPALPVAAPSLPVAAPSLPPSALSLRNHPGHRAGSKDSRGRGRQAANHEWKAAEQAWGWASGAAHGGGGIQVGLMPGDKQGGYQPAPGITDEGGTRPPEAPGMLAGPAGRPGTPGVNPRLPGRWGSLALRPRPVTWGRSAPLGPHPPGAGLNGCPGAALARGLALRDAGSMKGLQNQCGCGPCPSGV